MVKNMNIRNFETSLFISCRNRNDISGLFDKQNCDDGCENYLTGSKRVSARLMDTYWTSSVTESEAADTAKKVQSPNVDLYALLTSPEVAPVASLELEDTQKGNNLLRKASWPMSCASYAFDISSP